MNDPADEWFAAAGLDTITVARGWDQDREKVLRGPTVGPSTSRITYELPGTVRAWCEEQGIDVIECPGDPEIFRIAPKNDAEAVFVKLRWY